jgi:hypothetical protein
MKKTLSVFLAVLMLLLTASAAAFAAEGDGFIQMHTVRVAPASEGKIEIVNVEANGDEPASNTVKHGGTFCFTVKYVGGYAPDDTTLIKCYPSSYPGDLVVTPEDSTEITTLTPDEYGVYTITNITEDYYVAAINAMPQQFSSLKQMLIDFFNAIRAFFARIFNR